MAIEFSSNNNEGLIINKTGTDSTSPLTITNTGSGNDIDAANWSVTPTGYGHFAGLVLGDGTQVLKGLSATATLDFGNIAAGSSVELTITVTGAASGNICMVTPAAGIEDNLIWCGYVSAADTVTVRLSNNNLLAGTNPASRSWRAVVIQF